MKHRLLTIQDFLSQAALRQPCPRPHDADFVRKWAGLSVFDSEAEVRSLGLARNWKPGIYIATIEIPDDAPIWCEPPDRPGSGHWLLYDSQRAMLDESSAPDLIGYVVRIVHGLTGE
ncbi:MAG: hypothetical protein IT306_18155 [Chloroflexi bacterium]|nr:hypothetical protein [Chloroflexota bacterium]